MAEIGKGNQNGENLGSTAPSHLAFRIFVSLRRERLGEREELSIVRAHWWQLYKKEVCIWFVVKGKMIS